MKPLHSFLGGAFSVIIVFIIGGLVIGWSHKEELKASSKMLLVSEEIAGGYFISVQSWQPDIESSKSSLLLFIGQDQNEVRSWRIPVNQSLSINVFADDEELLYLSAMNSTFVLESGGGISLLNEKIPSTAERAEFSAVPVITKR